MDSEVSLACAGVVVLPAMYSNWTESESANITCLGAASATQHGLIVVCHVQEKGARSYSLGVWPVWSARSVIVRCNFGRRIVGASSDPGSHQRETLNIPSCVCRRRGSAAVEEDVRRGRLAYITLSPPVVCPTHRMWLGEWGQMDDRAREMPSVGQAALCVR